MADSSLFSQSFEAVLGGQLIGLVKDAIGRIEKEYRIKAEYLSKGDACTVAGVARPTLESWLRKGLPVSKIEGCYLIKRTDLDDFIEAHKIGE